jgi:ethanolamine utilization protein EutN
MLRATVVGNVWSTRRLPEVPAGALLDVETDTGSRLVALDVLGCGIGEQVLVVTGSVAAAWFPGEAPPIDALVIGSIDTQTPSQSPSQSYAQTSASAGQSPSPKE